LLFFLAVIYAEKTVRQPNSAHWRSCFGIFQLNTWLARSARPEIRHESAASDLRIFLSLCLNSIN
jgi:hypothetical protein